MSSKLQSDVRYGGDIWWMLTGWRPDVVHWGGGVFASCCRGSNCSLARSMDGRINAAAPLTLADQLPLPMIVICKARLVRFPRKMGYTRGVQKVRRPTQLTMRYAYHILSLFNTDTCNWNALGPSFLQSSDHAVDELFFLVFQPVIRRSDNVLVVRKWCVFSWILSV